MWRTEIRAQPHSAAANALPSALSHTSAGMDGRSGSTTNDMATTCCPADCNSMRCNGYENSNRHYAKASFSVHKPHTLPMTPLLQKSRPSLTLRDLIDPFDLLCSKAFEQIWPWEGSQLIRLLTVRVGCIDLSVVYCSYHQMLLSKRPDRHVCPIDQWSDGLSAM